MVSPSAAAEVAVGFGNGVIRDGSVAIGVGVRGGVDGEQAKIASAIKINAEIKIRIL